MAIRVTDIFKIPQYTSDPANPSKEDSWVLRQGSGGGIVTLSTEGAPIGLLLSLTYPVTLTTTGVAFTYQFSYRNKEGSTIRTTLS